MTQHPHQNDAERFESAAMSRPVAEAAPAERGRRSLLPRSTTTWVVRVAAIAAIAWAAIAPSYRAAVSAASQPPAARVDASSRQAVGEYAAAGTIGDYYTARGGQRTFGAALSNPFTLTGAEVQLFRNHALKLNPDGSVSTLPLLDMGAIPGVRIGGRTLPQPDPELINSAPQPGTPDYAAQAQAFISANAPDEWQGVPVGFHRAFLDTVTFQDAFPGGTGERGLLPGMAQEIWGLPVSRPMRDPDRPDVVYLRWERGVMAFDAASAVVETVPLGETFRAILTGEGIPGDLIASAQSSPYYAQFQPSAVNAIARPEALPDSSLAGAFQVSGSAGFTSAAAGQTGAQPPYPTYDPYATPSATPWGGTSAWETPTATPWGGTSAWGTPTATPWGGTSGQFPNSGTGGTGGSIGGSGIQSSGGMSPNPAASPGVDMCYGDEQITYAPLEPRVGNEFLIAVSSSRPHPYGRLAGTEATQFQRERQGQLGLVWEWIVRPTYPGAHKYTFYVDSTIPCKEIEINVLEQLATATPKPTKTPTPYGWDNGNGNGNSNNNSNDNNGFSTTDGSADVSVSLSGPSSASINQSVSYTATIANSGPEDAENATFTATVFESGVSFSNVTANNGGSCSQQSGTTISCNVGRIDRNTQVTIPFTVQVTQSAPSSFTLSVNGSSSRSDSFFTNNNYTMTVSVSGSSTSTDGGSTTVPPPGGSVEQATVESVGVATAAGFSVATVILARNQARYELRLGPGCPIAEDQRVTINSSGAFAVTRDYDRSDIVLPNNTSCIVHSNTPK